MMLRIHYLKIHFGGKRLMTIAPKSNTAIYTRLSIENSGKATDKTVMATQIEYCKNYMISNKSLHLVDIYADDGISGTHLHRPELNRLTGDIKKGLIQTIVIRDFTRLSRDVIDMGYLMEKFFPLYGVRIIAIADGYDSAIHQEIDEFYLKFHYVLSDYYSRDLSVKVKSSVNNRMKRGTYLSGLTIYGYRKDEHKHMAIDIDTADHVRFIFNAYCTGMGISDICKTLHKKQIPTPSAHRQGNPNTEWSPHTIRKILGDERYTGTYVAGKTKQIKSDRPKQLQTPKKEWIVIKNHHDAIISYATFEKAQGMKRNVISKKTNLELQSEKEQIPLWGKVYCGYCHRKMQRKGKKTFTYYCRYRSQLPSCQCNDNHIKEIALEKKVYSFLCQEAKQRNTEREKNATSPTKMTVNSYPLELKKKQKQQLFEQFISGNLSEAEYTTKKIKLNQNKELSSQTSTATVQKVDFIESVNTSTTLTKQLATDFIDCIYVYKENVEISLHSIF